MKGVDFREFYNIEGAVRIPDQDSSVVMESVVFTIMMIVSYSRTICGIHDFTFFHIAFQPEGSGVMVLLRGKRCAEDKTLSFTTSLPSRI